MKISDEEYNLIIEEFANRIRDMAYGKNFEERLKKQFSKEEVEDGINSNDTSTDICYNFNCCTGDWTQVLNRIRRNKK